MKKLILLLLFFPCLFADTILQFGDIGVSPITARQRLMEKLHPLLEHSKILEEGFVRIPVNQQICFYIKIQMNEDYIATLTSNLMLMEIGWNTKEAYEKVKSKALWWENSHRVMEYQIFPIIAETKQYFCAANLEPVSFLEPLPFRFTAMDKDKAVARTKAEAQAKLALKDYTVQKEEYQQAGIMWICHLFVIRTPIPFRFMGIGKDKEEAKARAEFFAKAALQNYVIQKEEYKQQMFAWVCHLFVLKSNAAVSDYPEAISFHHPIYFEYSPDATIQNSHLLFIGIGADKETARQNLNSQVQVIVGEAAGIAKEWFTEENEIRCFAIVKAENKPVNRTYASEKLNLQLSYLQINKNLEPVKFMFIGVGLSKEQARARAEYQAKLSLGGNYSVEKDTYVPFGAMVTCYLVVAVGNNYQHHQEITQQILFSEQEKSESLYETYLFIPEQNQWVYNQYRKETSSKNSSAFFKGNASHFTDVIQALEKSNDFSHVQHVHYDCQKEVWRCWLK